MKEKWLMSGAVVPVDVETTAALVAEIHRLIGVVGNMALAQASQEPDVQETLHWYAFNYRQAHTAQAHEMWLELEQFVDRKMKAPQRTEQEPQIAFNAEVVGYVASQREWVGLSDEEAQWLYDNCRTPSNLIDMTEAKLKDKNT